MKQKTRTFKLKGSQKITMGGASADYKKSSAPPVESSRNESGDRTSSYQLRESLSIMTSAQKAWINSGNKKRPIDDVLDQAQAPSSGPTEREESKEVGESKESVTPSTRTRSQPTSSTSRSTSNSKSESLLLGPISRTIHQLARRYRTLRLSLGIVRRQMSRRMPLRGPTTIKASL